MKQLTVLVPNQPGQLALITEALAKLSVNIEDFDDETGIELPDGPYETVAGFVVSRLGSLPVIGDAVELAGQRFEVLELDGRRISRVRVTPLPAVGDDHVPSESEPLRE